MGLPEMLEHQTNLQYEIWSVVPDAKQWDELTNRERCEMIAHHVSHLVTEAGEFLNELPFYKQWKKYEDHENLEDYPNWAEMWEEYIDIFLFFLNGLILMGKSATDLENEYERKRGIVLIRERERHLERKGLR